MHTFRDVPFDKELCLLVDVRQVDLKAVDKGEHPFLKPHGWSLLPVIARNSNVPPYCFRFAGARRPAGRLLLIDRQCPRPAATPWPMPK